MPGCPGSWNDKTIVRYDHAVYELKNNPIYCDRVYQTLAEDGTNENKGLYFITDGGYHYWRELICPWKHSHLKMVHSWSKRLESVRKDVECVFGRLKGRFRILKLPCRFQSATAIDNLWFSACVLHNMILEFDGLDSRWEKGVKYDKEDGQFDIGEGEELATLFKRDSALLGVSWDSSSRGKMNLSKYDNTVVERDQSHFDRKRILVQHFHMARKKREVVWY